MSFCSEYEKIVIRMVMKPSALCVCGKRIIISNPKPTDTKTSLVQCKERNIRYYYNLLRTTQWRRTSTFFFIVTFIIFFFWLFKLIAGRRTLSISHRRLYNQFPQFLYDFSRPTLRGNLPRTTAYDGGPKGVRRRENRTQRYVWAEKSIFNPWKTIRAKSGVSSYTHAHA